MAENHLIKERLGKLKELVNWGVNPYPYTYQRTTTCAALQKKYEALTAGDKKDDTVKIAGRIMAVRDMGKVQFLTVQDETTTVQVYVRKDELGEQYKVIKKLDIGDWVGAEGTIFKTKTGEVSVHASSCELLTKSLRPLPEKYHGLKDKELRYRQRAVDMIMNPQVRTAFRQRATIIQTVRKVLIGKDYLEVEVPLLQTTYGGGDAEPFVTKINAWNMDMFLSISPELYLKRCIVGNLGNVFTITKNFRNEGVDRTHNPEFTMMECYKPYTDYNEMMDLVEEIYEQAALAVHGKTTFTYGEHEIDVKRPWPRLTMYDAIKEYAGIDDIKSYSDDQIKALLKEHKIKLEHGYVRGLAIAEIFEELCEDKLIQPVHIIDHPKETTVLCKAHREDPDLIERFESYIMGMEICNAYSELNDPQIQRKLMKAQEERGRGGDLEAAPMDSEYVETMEYGMPPAGGLGVGIDRMVILLTNSESIRDVILFPTMKPLHLGAEENKE